MLVPTLDVRNAESHARPSEPTVAGLNPVADNAHRPQVAVHDHRDCLLEGHGDRVHAKIAERLAELEGERRHFVSFNNDSEFTRRDWLEPNYAGRGRPYQRSTSANANGLVDNTFPRAMASGKSSHRAVNEVERPLAHFERWTLINGDHLQC
jgi:hypothetical protein